MLYAVLIRGFEGFDNRGKKDDRFCSLTVSILFPIYMSPP